MSQGPTAFVADVAWRVEPPPRRDRARLFAAILAAILIELSVFALIWTGRGSPPAPQVKEIPVEIIVEKPAPSPSPRAQPQSQEYLKPAFDAPRAGKSDHDDEHVADKPKPAKAPPPQPTPTATPAKAAPAPALELPQTAEAKSPPPQKAEPVETPAPARPTVAEVLAKALDPIPNVEFGGEAMRAPVSGGQARATYLTILFGLTRAHLHIPAAVHGYPHRLIGVIGLTVGGDGRLLQRYIVESSGSPELDEAEMRAVGDASRHFPAPPHHATIGLTYTFSEN